jgi:hypothetical protein
MSLYFKDGGKITGTISDGDRYVLDVVCGTIRKLEDKYQLVAKVNCFSHLQKFGDNGFILPEGSIIYMDLHDKEWETKKWDKAKGGYTDEIIKHTPSIQELALLEYAKEEKFISEDGGKVFFTGIIELVNSKVAKQVVMGDLSNRSLLFDIKTTDAQLTDTELATATAKPGGGKNYKSPQETYADRLAVFKLSLAGVPGIEQTGTLLEVSKVLLEARLTEEWTSIEIALSLAKLFIK